MDRIPRVTVGALIFNTEGKILLIKSPKWHDQYLVPGGHVDFRETLRETVKREVKEETDLDIFNIKFVCVLEFPHSLDFHKKNKHFVGIQFSCQTNGIDVTLNEEATDYVWMHPKNAIKMTDLQRKTKEAIEIYLKKKI